MTFKTGVSCYIVYAQISELIDSGVEGDYGLLPFCEVDIGVTLEIGDVGGGGRTGWAGRSVGMN